MSSFVRASKFRHVFSDAPRPDTTFQNLRLSTVTGEQNYIKANPLFFAVGTQVDTNLKVDESGCGFQSFCLL